MENPLVHQALSFHFTNLSYCCERLVPSTCFELRTLDCCCWMMFLRGESNFSAYQILTRLKFNAYQILARTIFQRTILYYILATPLRNAKIWYALKNDLAKYWYSLKKGDLQYTFLMILQPSDAQNSSFLQIFQSFKKYTQKVMPKDAGICMHKG